MGRAGSREPRIFVAEIRAGEKTEERLYRASTPTDVARHIVGVRKATAEDVARIGASVEDVPT